MKMVTTQTSQVSPEIQQQISVLNARISNANLAYGDLLKEMNNTFTAMTTLIGELQKENAELKSKAKDGQKKAKTA
ncbi:MAG: hypothetical protein CW716_07410 [Candidatus Bathyarchaeum sp.]|nr:MAG: hypothetical protein CW716_07410 [Candidatus Bathyarchaeum sp.]